MISVVRLANPSFAAEASFIAIGGGAVAGGVYVSYTKQQGLDVGLYGSVSGGIGANIGLGINGGYVPGDAGNISGTTLDLTGGYGPFTATTSGAISRPTYASYSVGVGFGLPASGSLSSTRTVHGRARGVVKLIQGSGSAGGCSEGRGFFDIDPNMPYPGMW